MSDVPQTLALITLAQEFRGDVVAQVNRRTTLLKMLRIVPGGGKNTSWVTEADGAIGENHSDGEDAGNLGSDAQDDAILAWGLYRSNFHVTKLAMDAAGSASSPMGNRLLWARNLSNASAKLADTLEIALFNGAGTGTTIAGLDVAIGDDGNTYATINRASGSNAYFRPTVVDPGSPTSPTLALLRADIGTIGDAGGETPDIAVCGTAVFNRVAGLFDANRRWNVVNTARGAVKLDAGYEGIEVDGCMFVKARRATANTIYYLNTNYVEIEYLPDSSYPAEVYQQVRANDGFGSVPLGFSYSMLAKNGPADRAQVLAQMQLRVRRPNACGVRLNVAV